MGNSIAQSEFEDLLFNCWHPDAAFAKQQFEKYMLLPKDVRIAKLLLALESNSDGIILRAARYLIAEEREKHISRILTFLDSQDESIRWVTCNVLGAAKIKEAKQNLERVATVDSSVDVRGMAIVALSQCGDHDTINILSRIQQSDMGIDRKGFRIADLAIQSKRRLETTDV